MTRRRRTVARPVALEGIGLHCGRRCAVELMPEPRRRGVWFRRIDLEHRPVIEATLDNVGALHMRTQLRSGGTTVDTVEHLLAAIWGVRIDDLLIELDGPEVPVLDGSALPFVRALEDAGVVEKGDAAPPPLKPRNSFEVEAGEARYQVEPSESFSIDCRIEWDDLRIGTQRASFVICGDVIRQELAGARTFGFESQAVELKENGLAQGADHSNVIVLSDTAGEGAELRWPDEFVRHKTLDMIGDLRLLGRDLLGAVTAVKPSHRGNFKLSEAMRNLG